MPTALAKVETFLGSLKGSRKHRTPINTDHTVHVSITPFILYIINVTPQFMPTVLEKVETFLGSLKGSRKPRTPINTDHTVHVSITSFILYKCHPSVHANSPRESGDVLGFSQG